MHNCVQNPGLKSIQILESVINVPLIVFLKISQVTVYSCELLFLFAVSKVSSRLSVLHYICSPRNPKDATKNTQIAMIWGKFHEGILQSFSPGTIPSGYCKSVTITPGSTNQPRRGRHPHQPIQLVQGTCKKKPHWLNRGSSACALFVGWLLSGTIYPQVKASKTSFIAGIFLVIRELQKQ